MDAELKRIESLAQRIRAGIHPTQAGEVVGRSQCGSNPHRKIPRGNRRRPHPGWQWSYDLVIRSEHPCRTRAQASLHRRRDLVRIALS